MHVMMVMTTTKTATMNTFLSREDRLDGQRDPKPIKLKLGPLDLESRQSRHKQVIPKCRNPFERCSQL